MANDVFANGREISCKKADGKTICAFPDVCFTPPENPATPPGVPVPYPNTAFAKDTTSGSKKVKISGQEVMLKNKSYFKTSTGDEAGSAAKKGVITSTNKGKAYFVSWSPDVKVEGENVVRHLDMTTNNHASPMANESVPWAHVDSMAVGGHSCKKITEKIHSYDNEDCPDGSQSHHIVDNSNFTMPGARSTSLKNIATVGGTEGRAKRNLFPKGSKHPGRNYDENKAPCICLEGGKSDPTAQHGIAHASTKQAALNNATPDGKWKYSQARDEGVKSIKKALKLKDWEGECLKLVLDAYYKDKMKCKDDTELVAPTGRSYAASHFDNGSGAMCQSYVLT